MNSFLLSGFLIVPDTITLSRGFYDYQVFKIVGYTLVKTIIPTFYREKPRIYFGCPTFLKVLKIELLKNMESGNYLAFGLGSHVG